MLKLLFPIALAAAAIAFAAPAQTAGESAFEFEPVDLGLLQQGIKKPVEIKGRNVSSKAIEVESVFSQMSGGENFVYPKKINPGQEFKIKYDLSTSYIEGDFLHNVILVDAGGTPHLAVVKGSVENPIVFSERILDLGFYKKGKRKKWAFYAWNADGKALKLKLGPESQKEFKAEFASVKLDARDFENVKEGGSAPGVKIILSVSELEPPGNSQRSIRRIVSFICENFPSATPGLLVTGYWE